VTIAHRLATVRHCDLVLYLEAGRVVGRGTFAEVREQSPAFDHQAQLLGL
jgi:ABC-type multidrug transport system fused ATPase/permease subunit